ncbi:MAG TPA: LCP family protein [Patescibacteria group bacterium]|nr:LCP family protein [Patescibacteria group bacterium]
MSKKNKKILIIIVSIIFLALAVKVISFSYRFFPFVFQLTFNRDIELKQKDDQINILLMGIGGGKHDGPNLTDTIIFASINPKLNKVNLVSLPRDLWIPDLRTKINVAYAQGEAKRKGGGLVLVEAVVSKILNKDVDYGLRIDFNGFVRAVDLLEGLDIDIERSFDDYEYPDEGKENDLCGHKEEELEELATASSQLEAFPCRYKHLHFDKGVQHMDGEKVLEYVRSRHAEGAEGSDFARSRRQEKVITAFKDKIFSLKFLANPGKLFDFYSIIKESIDTDIKDTEFDDFVRLLDKAKESKIQNALIDIGDEKTNREGLLINPDPDEEYDYQWVLIPRTGNGNFLEIQKYIDCELKMEGCIIPKFIKN